MTDLEIEGLIHPPKTKVIRVYFV